MKRIIPSLAALFVATTAFADWVIEAKVENPQINGTTLTKIKGDKMRSDMQAGPMGATSTIMDTVSGDSSVLMHGQKMVMKTSGAQIKQMFEAGKKAAALDSEQMKKTAPKSTGKTEKVGEFDCEIWTYSDDSVELKYWVAKNHPQAEAMKSLEKKMSMMSQGLQAGAGPDATALPGPAIKTESLLKAMNLKTTMTVLSVKQENVDAKEFEIPSDYKTMAMPGLPQPK
jgi:hypothetical protein